MQRILLKLKLNFITVLILLTLPNLLPVHITLAQPNVPTGFADEIFSSGWIDLTTIAFDSAGRLYVGEHEGTIWQVDANGVKSSAPIINIRSEVGWWNAHGLMNFVLDKDFLSNGYIYLYYTVDRHHLLYYGTPQYNENINDFHSPTIERVTRFQLDSATNFTTVVPGSRFVLLGDVKTDGPPVTYNHHDGGGMAMGLDRTLIIATGDGAHGGAMDTGSNSQTYYIQALADSILTPATNVGTYRSQLLNSLSGKILRIDPMTGYGMPSNPFYDPQNPKSVASRVWSVGLRQPFRLTIRPGTGSNNSGNGDPGVIYLGDVGFYNWEEMNVVTGPGQNFGWPVYEGVLPHPQFSSYKTKNLDAPNPLYGVITNCKYPFFRFKDLITNYTLGVPSWPNPCDASQQIPASAITWVHRPPSFAYAHHSVSTYLPVFNGSVASYAQLGAAGTNTSGIPFGGNCIAGTGFNIWNDWPAQYHNAMFFSEFDRGFISYAKYDSQQKLLSIDTFATGLGRPISVTWHPIQHCLYYIDYQYKIHRIRYTIGTNIHPVAIASQDIKFGPGPLTLNFSSAKSFDPDGSMATYFWSFGDGQITTLANPTHTFTPSGSNPVKYLVTLTVTDSGGLSDSTQLIVSVNNTPPVVNITSPINGSYYSIIVSQVHNLTAQVSDAEHNASQLHYFWYTTLHHNAHDHPNPPDTDAITYMISDPEDCESDYYYEVRLTVTDDAGLSTTDTIRMYQGCVPDVDFKVNDDTSCVGTALQFTDLTKLFPNNWSWQFPGGTPATSNIKNPKVTYKSPGTYNVQLTASSPGGQDSLVKNGFIVINNLPGVNITASGPTAICTGDSVNLITNFSTTYSYLWKKNSVNIPGATGSSYYAKAGGNYSVKVTNKYGCSKLSKQIKVESPFVAKIEASTPLTFCDGDSVVLNASPSGTGYTYQWLRNSANIDGETLPAYIAKSAGHYRVLISKDTTCSNLSNAKNITVNCRILSDKKNNRLVEVNPNPSHNSFVITLTDNTTNVTTLTLTDMTGRLLQKVDLLPGCNNFILGGNLNPGIYFLSVSQPDIKEVIRLEKM